MALALLITIAPAVVRAQAPAPPPPSPPAPNFPPPPVAGGPPGVAAVVNGQPIPRTQVVRTALTLAGQQALQQLIADTLIDQEAKKQGISATPTEVEARITQIRQQLVNYPGGLEAFIKANNTTLADIKESQRVRIEAQKLAAKTQKPVHRAHIHYIVILTVTPGGDPNAKPHTDAEAQAIVAKAQADLKAGQTFETVAGKYTEDAGKASGGELKGNNGQIMLIGPESTSQFDPAFVQAALALKPGEVTPTPVHSTQFGYFLLKAVSTSEAPGADKPLYNEATQQDGARQVQTYFQTLLHGAKITNYFTP